ncbi:putative AC transposase [Bienertia sinuspersici]
MVILEFLKIIHSIKQTSNANPNAPVKNVYSMKVKWNSYFNEFTHIYGIAGILDLRVKVEGLTNLLTFYYELLGSNYDVAYYVIKCQNILDRLCEFYGAVIQPEPIGSSSKDKYRFGFLGPVLKKQRPNSSSSSSSNVGVDEYLSYQFEIEDNFHITQWWKNHSSKFPVLARIATDILAILTSTITSESAFSACRRVLDEKRSYSAPQNIELYVCKKDWDQGRD